MRYLGNKSNLVHFIDKVIQKYKIEGDIFADLFAGTCSVGDYFKDRYKIIANDYMKFSSIICKAKILNHQMPKFDDFNELYKTNPFTWLNNREYEPRNNYFIFKNYTPVGDRMYLTEENALKIDGMRLDIEELYKNEILDEKEYSFLLASLLGSVLKVSNTSGTYQAFFKFWEPRALKKFKIIPLEINETDKIYDNEIYNINTNKLVREISGDIAYIDPPYTITQYTNSYHLLETVAKYDYPNIFGKTGRRSNRELSGYSNKSRAIEEFEDLFRQIQFTHVLVSYSNQSIVPIGDLVELAKKFAVDGKVYIEANEYREYATNNSSHKGDGKKLKEIIIYFKKDMRINKSPLNYSGSKDGIMPLLTKELPKHVGTFVDMMGGAFNVGANVVATDCVIYNEYNKYVYDIIKLMIENKPEFILSKVNQIIAKYDLKKKDKESYMKLREDYNKCKDPLYLFVLQIYAFQNMIRFNNNQQMNTPVGNNEFSDGIAERIKSFYVRTTNCELICNNYKDIDINNFPIDTVFYFDPPYFITKAEYNDGKRGLEGWNSDKESEMLNYILNLHKSNYKFMLSNVLTHNGKKHHLLIEWIEEHGFNIVPIGKTGIKYPREEVLITNYNIFE